MEGNLGFQRWSMAKGQLLAQKAASLWTMEAGVCTEDPQACLSVYKL